MGDYSFHLDEESARSAASIHDGYSCFGDFSNTFDTDLVSSTALHSAGTFSKILPPNCFLPIEKFSGLMPTDALMGCSGSDFTTSPASTATSGIFTSPFNDGHNPFDASFGEITYPDTHQQLLYDISSSQTSLQSPDMQWTSSHSAFPPNSVQLNTDLLYAPRPKRSSGDLVEELQQGRPVEALETCAISFAQSPSRKRRRTADEPSREAEAIPSDRKLPIRHKTMPSMTHVHHGNISTQAIASGVPNISPSVSKTNDNIAKRPGPESSSGNSAIEKERHKYVEMKYRKHMKDRFEELMLALPTKVANIDPAGKSGIVFQKKIRRGKVLDLAKEHIDLLEREKNKLELERQILQREVKVYEGMWFGNMGVPGHVVPLN